jgi:hypothetical protein
VCVEWIHLGQDTDCQRALVNRGDEPLGSGATELVRALRYITVSGSSLCCFVYTTSSPSSDASLLQH